MIDFLNAKIIFTPKGEVASIARGAEILWQKLKLPIEYQEVPYIESTGSQWIDTGYIPNNKTELEIVASGISESSFALSASGTWFFGARAGYLSNAFGSYYNPTEKNFYYAFGNVMPSASYTSLYESTRTIQAKATGLYVDGKQIVPVSASNFTAPVPLVLFALNNNGTVISRTNYKMHSCKIWDNEVLVRDYVPCYRKSDGEVGVYDLVTKTFFTNAGTGEFYCEKPKYKTELAYLESTGTQWIDTGTR